MLAALFRPTILRSLRSRVGGSTRMFYTPCTQALCSSSRAYPMAGSGSSADLAKPTAPTSPTDPLSSAEYKTPSYRSFGYLESPRTVAVIGAPMSLGQPLVGVDEGPAILRNGGLHSKLADLRWRIFDRGDLDFTKLDTSDDVPNARYARAVGKANEMLAEAVEEEAQKGRFVMTLGGDHSVATGSINGLLRARPDTGVIWVDAHADLNTPATSHSSNIHGMAVAFLMHMKDCAHDVPGFEWMQGTPALGKDRIVYIGLRDVDRPERKFIRDMGIRAFTMQDVDRLGMSRVIELALQHLGECPLHMSIDIDAVDPFLAASTGTRVRGGLTFRESNYVCEAVAETGRLASLDMVEVNPEANRGKAQETVDTAISMIGSALGERIL